MSEGMRRTRTQSRVTAATSGMQISSRFDTIEMTAFRLKLMARRSTKNILISAGKLPDKERMLPTIRTLSQGSFTIYATKGTSEFLNKNGVRNKRLYKITESREPNIKSFLSKERLDLVINVLTGDNDYDEASDSKLIRTLAIEYGIPLITDAEVGIMMLENMSTVASAPAAEARELAVEPWNLQRRFLDLVANAGGFACYHAHFDKAYLISMDNLKLGMVDMQKKWALYKYLKENYTFDDLVERITRATQKMVDQGVTYCRTFVDADSTVKLLPIKAVLEVKQQFKNQIQLEVAVQPLQGVLDKESRKYFVKACELADAVGGLPSKDRPTPEKHLDFILDLAKDLKKPLDVHVDQENNPFECETEQLAVKTIEHGMEGRVFAVHAISVAAKDPAEQDRILARVKDAGVSVIVCPSAALSMKQLEARAPLHNSIAPVPKLLEKGIPVYLGVDNIADLFMPLVDGDMWFEARALMEACRFYDVEAVARIAADKGGIARPTKGLV